MSLRFAQHFSLRSSFVALAIISASAAPMLPVFAQSGSIEGRVGKLEKEMQAVQRKVFPGGAGGMLQPDLSPVPAETQIGTPASSPLEDLTARVSAIESQLARLTGQVEQNDYRLKQLEQAFAEAKSVSEAAAAPVPSAVSTGQASAAPSSASATTRPAAVLPTRNAADPSRVEAVAAVERPSTGNAASDSYTYGYRLWAAKFYPEAQVQLRETVEKYGKSDVGSRAQNLLGRAYLDAGQSKTAATVLYENYRLRPKGDRAAESLAYTAEALIQLNRSSDACLAYDELRDVFGATMQPSLRGMMEKGRVRAKCGA